MADLQAQAEAVNDVSSALWRLRELAAVQGSEDPSASGRHPDHELQPARRIAVELYAID
jgi:hypothetical protein